jgi:hypothetical protein
MSPQRSSNHNTPIPNGNKTSYSEWTSSCGEWSVPKDADQYGAKNLNMSGRESGKTDLNLEDWESGSTSLNLEDWKSGSTELAASTSDYNSSDDADLPQQHNRSSVKINQSINDQPRSGPPPTKINNQPRSVYDKNTPWYCGDDDDDVNSDSDGSSVLSAFRKNSPKRHESQSSGIILISGLGSEQIMFLSSIQHEDSTPKIFHKLQRPVRSAH